MKVISTCNHKRNSIYVLPINDNQSVSMCDECHDRLVVEIVKQMLIGAQGQICCNEMHQVQIDHAINDSAHVYELLNSRIAKLERKER